MFRRLRSRPPILLAAMLLIGAALSAVVVVGGSSPAAAAPTLDHFQCYAAQSVPMPRLPCPGMMPRWINLLIDFLKSSDDRYLSALPKSRTRSRTDFWSSPTRSSETKLLGFSCPSWRISSISGPVPHLVRAGSLREPSGPTRLLTQLGSPSEERAVTIK